MNERIIGKNLVKVDARVKVTGRALYPDDLYFAEMLYVKVKRAVHPHAILRKLEISRAQQLPGVVKIITAADYPELNNFGLIIKDQPVLVGIGEKMRYLGDALAIVVAESKEAAGQALAQIRVEVEELEVIDDPRRAMEEQAPLLHPDGNILCRHQLNKGELERGLAAADLIVEQEYKTNRVEQLPLQPEAGVCVYDQETGVLKLWVATQWLHDTQADIAQALGIPPERVRIIQPVIGGAFGKREDISVHIHLALAALATRRPVKLTYTREESMITQSKRHPMIIRAKSGATRDGYLTAWQVEIIGDTGAYASSGPAVVHKGLYHCTGPYNVENVRGIAYTVYTNNTYSGAMRGFGATQLAFAYESQIDILAHRLRIDPARFRYQNAYRPGSSTPNGQVLTDSVNVRETIKEAVQMSNWPGGVEL